MLCKICKINEAETTDCRCRFCIGKQERYLYKNNQWFSVGENEADKLSSDGVATPEENDK